MHLWGLQTFSKISFVKWQAHFPRMFETSIRALSYREGAILSNKFLQEVILLQLKCPTTLQISQTTLFNVQRIRHHSRDTCSIFPDVVTVPADDRQPRWTQNQRQNAHEHVDAHCIADGCTNISIRLWGVLHPIKNCSREALESSHLKQCSEPPELANPMPARPQRLHC